MKFGLFTSSSRSLPRSVPVSFSTSCFSLMSFSHTFMTSSTVRTYTKTGFFESLCFRASSAIRSANFLGSGSSCKQIVFFALMRLLTSTTERSSLERVKASWPREVAVNSITRNFANSLDLCCSFSMDISNC